MLCMYYVIKIINLYLFSNSYKFVWKIKELRIHIFQFIAFKFANNNFNISIVLFFWSVVFFYHHSGFGQYNILNSILIGDKVT